VISTGINDLVNTFRGIMGLPPVNLKVNGESVKQNNKNLKQTANYWREMLGLPAFTPKTDDSQLKKVADATGISIKKLRELFNLPPAKPKIDVQSNAEEQARRARNAINSVKSKRVYIDTIYRRGNVSANPGGTWTGGPITGYARGGKLGGTPPSNPRADNLLGLVGQKLIGLRSGEFVMNEPATKMFGPILGAMNRLAMGGSRVDMPNRATGGPVSPTVTIPSDLGQMSDAQMRRQAKFNAEALKGATFKILGNGDLQLIAAGG
jgi:hypothetical protein